MILEKYEDLNFCNHISDDRKSTLSGIIRRLSITTTSNDLMPTSDDLHVRSLLVFRNNKSDEYFARSIPTKYMLLKVLDYEFDPLLNVSKNFGNLIHFKYLSFRHSKDMFEIPNSIGMLLNLETLDVRDTSVRQLQRRLASLES